MMLGRDIEETIRLNKRYLKKFGHLEKFNALQVHGGGVYYPLWKIQEYKKIKVTTTV